jgi:hypothetical protein
MRLIEFYKNNCVFVTDIITNRNIDKYMVTKNTQKVTKTQTQKNSKLQNIENEKNIFVTL